MSVSFGMHNLGIQQPVAISMDVEAVPRDTSCFARQVSSGRGPKRPHSYFSWNWQKVKRSPTNWTSTHHQTAKCHCRVSISVEKKSRKPWQISCIKIQAQSFARGNWKLAPLLRGQTYWACATKNGFWTVIWFPRCNLNSFRVTRQMALLKSALHISGTALPISVFCLEPFKNTALLQVIDIWE